MKFVLRLNDYKIKLFEISENFALNLTVFLFMAHGLAYIFVPQQVYDPSSPIKLVKYICVIAYYLILLKKGMLKRHELVAYLLTLSVLSLFYFPFNSTSNIASFIFFTLPLSFFFFRSAVQKINYYSIALSLFILASVAGYIEFFYLDNPFYMFMGGPSVNKYRLVSIFVNPNNAGINFALLTFYLLLPLQKLNSFAKLLILLNGILTVRLTGSKTGIILLGIYLMALAVYWIYQKREKIYKFFLKVKFKAILFLVGLFLAGIIQLYFIVSEKFSGSVRSFNLKTLFIRFESYLEFFSTSNNIVFPWLNGFTYTDNIYLYIWGSFGLLILLLFLGINLYAIKLAWPNKYFTLVLIFAFILSGITTNIVYLWPLGYIYWAFMGSIFYKVKVRV